MWFGLMYFVNIGNSVMLQRNICNGKCRTVCTQPIADGNCTRPNAGDIIFTSISIFFHFCFLFCFVQSVCVYANAA